MWHGIGPKDVEAGDRRLVMKRDSGLVGLDVWPCASFSRSRAENLSALEIGAGGECASFRDGWAHVEAGCGFDACHIVMMRVQTWPPVVADLLLRLSCQGGLSSFFFSLLAGLLVMSPASPGPGGLGFPYLALPHGQRPNPPGIAMLIDRSAMRASMMMISRNKNK